MAEIVNGISGALGSIYNSLPQILPHAKEVEKVVIREVQMIATPPAARTFVRLAGISGAVAVALGAYGSHGKMLSKTLFASIAPTEDDAPEAKLFMMMWKKHALVRGQMPKLLDIFRHQDVDPKLKDTFEIASKYHFIHTLALLAVPLTRKPVLSGSLMTAGLVLFCGSCYVHAMTSNVAIRKVTPYGGFLLIFAWASMAL